MIRNFLFHRVSPERDPLWDPMDIKLFNKCIEYISKKYVVVLFEEIAFDRRALATKDKLATIMFDDGYKDNIQYALPILEKHKVKASFYIVTDCIDNNTPTWTHILEHSFQFTTKASIDLSFDFLPREFRGRSFSSKEDRVLFVSKLKPFLKTIHHEQREKVLSAVSEQFSDVILPELMMDWQDVKKLKNLGHYIGSHTKSHSMLGTMDNDAEVERELVYSAHRIKTELGYFPLSISYPVGSFNDRTKQLSQNAGYKIGLAVKQQVFNPSIDGLFEVSRIELYNESWFKTKMRISNVLEDVKRMINYK